MLRCLQHASILWNCTDQIIEYRRVRSPEAWYFMLRLALILLLVKKWLGLCIESIDFFTARLFNQNN